MEKTMLVIRGIPGSGKTKLAEYIYDLAYRGSEDFPFIIGADDYPGYYDNKHGRYEWTPERNEKAHEWKYEHLSNALEAGMSPVIVHDVYATTEHLDRLIAMGREHGYTVHTVIVENRHGNTDVHEVPDVTKRSMVESFDIQLIPNYPITTSIAKAREIDPNAELAKHFF